MLDYFGWVDYMVVVLMLVISTSIGAFFAWKDRKNTDEDEFLRGGKHMAIIPVSISIMASFLPGTCFIGFPPVIYATGTTFATLVFPGVFAALIASEFFFPVYYNMNLVSVNEYLLKRFDSKTVQIVANISVLFAYIPFFGVEIFGPSIALSIVTDMSITASIFVIGGIVTLYTSLGGLKGVIWTDFFQFSIMLFGLMAVIVRGANVSGGMAEAFKKAYSGGRIEFWNMDFDIYSINSFWTIQFGYIIMFLGTFTTSQIQVQRVICMPSLASAKRALYLAIPGFSLVVLLVLLVGLIAYSHFYDCDPLLTGKVSRVDQLMPYFVLNIFEDNFKGLPGAYVACIFASSLSTLSSGLSAMSSIIWEDYAKKLFNRFPDKYNVFATRGLAAAIGLISIGAAFLVKQSDNLAEAGVSIYGSSIGPMFGLFSLGLFIPWANAWGVVTGLLTSQAICYWNVIAWVVDKRDPRTLMLGLSTDGCSQKNISVVIEGTPLSVLQNYKIPEYHPKGIHVIHHISPFFVPFLGFAISFVVGNVVSLATMGNRNRKVDVNLVSYKICCFLEKLLPKSWRQIECQNPRVQNTSAVKRLAQVNNIGLKMKNGNLDNGSNFSGEDDSIEMSPNTPLRQSQHSI